MSSIEDTTTSTVHIGTGSGKVTAIERFARPGAADERAADQEKTTVLHRPGSAGAVEAITSYVAAAERFLHDSLSEEDGFVAAVLLAGQRGELALYSQWTTVGEAPRHLPAAWSIASSVTGLDRVDGRTYAVDFTAPGPVTELTRGATPRAHFGVFSVEPERQEELLVLARRYAPESIGTPGLAAVNFHRSLDGHRVLNLGLWRGFGEFGQLLSRPGFVAGEKYWQDVAGFRPHFFDVAAVVA